MTDSTHRFRAFISYSHRDTDSVRWLHRALETYRVPHKLVGRETPLGPVPKTLAPIFRDRDELSASSDLSSELRAALAQFENVEPEEFVLTLVRSKPQIEKVIEGVTVPR